MKALIERWSHEDVLNSGTEPFTAQKGKAKVHVSDSICACRLIRLGYLTCGRQASRPEFESKVGGATFRLAISERNHIVASGARLTCAICECP
jgi:hypothetical protein